MLLIILCYASVLEGRVLVLFIPITPLPTLGKTCNGVVDVLVSLGTHVPGVSSSSYKDVSPIGLGPYLMTSVSLNYFIKGPISKYSTLEVRASTYGLGEGYNSVHNTG